MTLINSLHTSNADPVLSHAGTKANSLPSATEEEDVSVNFAMKIDERFSTNSGKPLTGILPSLIRSTKKFVYFNCTSHYHDCQWTISS